MSETNDFWLIIEPYIQVLMKGDKAIFYNTLSKKIVEIATDRHTRNLISKLIDKENAYVARIHNKDVNQYSVKKMIKALRRYYMADIWPVYWSEGKPVNLLPEPVIKFGISNPEPGLQEYLYEITLHLNTIHCQDKNHIAVKGFNQFLYPKVTREHSMEMDFSIIHSLFAQLSGLTKLKINLVGRDIQKYTEWSALHSLLKKNQCLKHYHVQVPGCHPEIVDQLKKNSYLALMISPQLRNETIEILNVFRAKCKNRIKCDYNFIVENNGDVEKVTAIIQELNLCNAYFRPYYNGNNQSFFKENVYLGPEEISASRPSQSQIFSRKSGNENDYGKLTVLPDGSVYANVNDKSLGNLNQYSLKELITKELKEGKSWKRSRLHIKPCRNCIYQWLCPPVSNYEIYMRKFNFCHLYQ